MKKTQEIREDNLEETVTAGGKQYTLFKSNGKWAIMEDDTRLVWGGRHLTKRSAAICVEIRTSSSIDWTNSIYPRPG